MKKEWGIHSKGKSINSNYGESKRGMIVDWNGRDRLRVAIFVDVDGTLASPYRNGKRELRSSASKALEMLSDHAPLFLWSIAGPENGLRLLKEFPHLKPFVSGCYGKEEFPFNLVDNPFCIDDEEVDDAVLKCSHIIVDTFMGGKNSNQLREAAQLITQQLTNEGLSCDKS